MRNITRLSELSDQLPINQGNYTLFTVDNVNGIIYLVTDTNLFIGYQPLSKQVKVKIELEQQDIISEGGKIVSIQFIPDSESVCMASSKGDILMYNVLTSELECVGIVGSGILAMSWSPDYELLVLATESNTLVQMTKEWDILNEVPINSLLSGGKLTSNIITNSNLPQAQYSQAHFDKGNLDKSKSIPEDQRGQQGEQAYIPTISWRGDGQFFVCSAYDEASGRVMLRCWERSLVIHSISETTIVGLECPLGWRPSGSLIAVPNHMEHRLEIALFERNGLKHGEFIVRDKGAIIESIQWSSDSEVLALQMTVGARSVVQLWHRSNYHWFLKHELQSADRFAAIQWDAGTTQTLRTVSKGGIYQEYTFCWDYDVSQGSSSDNPSIVLMVDGSSLKMTPFRRLVVPPPMSAYAITLTAPCSSFAFSTTYSVATITTDNTLSIYTPATLPPMPVTPHPSPVLPNFSVAPTLTATTTVDRSNIILANLRHLTWVPNSNTLVGVDSHSTVGVDTIVQLNLSYTSTSTTLTVDHIHRTPCHGRVLRIVTHQHEENYSNDRVLFETIDGSVFIYHLSNDNDDNSTSTQSITPYTIDHAVFKFPTPCPWITSCLVGGEECLVGLNDRNRLFINSTVVATDCNVYTLHNKFILFTTVSHLLRSIPLSLQLSSITPTSGTSQPINQQQQQQKNQPSTTIATPTQYDDSIREVERGARIVCAVPHDTRVVLQMPRGNLEAIAPRSLALSTIRELLNAHNYGQAFAVMRRNRIDMNFIYDHNPADFLKHINLFIEQVHQIDFLNLFITSLREEDTSKTLFIDLEKPPTPTLKVVSGTANSTDSTNKVNIICDKLRDAMIAKDAIRFNLPILTTYVKKTPQELDAVLRKVQSLRGQEITEHGETIVNRLAEESLDYIVFLVDVNKLYDVALGTYDFELVIMVAQKSQKDPKEYIAFLSDLQKMEPNYQRFMIDRHLERWSLALEHLSKSGDEYFEQCVELVEQHKLYREAVGLFTGDKLKRMQEVFGDSLAVVNHYDQAAFLYNACGADRKALQAFKDAGRWKMVVILAKKLGVPQADLNQMCHEIADLKRRSSHFTEASQIYTWVGEHETALLSLCEGGLWLDAYSYAGQVNHQEWIDEIIRVQINGAQQHLLEELAESSESYRRSYIRLGIVRTTKLNHVPLRLPGSAGMSGDDTTSMMSGMSGMFSETSGTSSVNSAITVSSYRSTYSSQTGTFSQATKSRNREANKKKKVNKVRVTGKEGSVYEEDFLVDTMKKLIPTSSKQENVCNLLHGLVLFNEMQAAKQVEQAFKSYLELVDQSLDLLSQSATAILPDNIKEQQRVQELEYNLQQQQMLQQLSNTNTLHHHHANNINNQQQDPIEKMTIKSITITRDKFNWSLNIY